MRWIELNLRFDFEIDGEGCRWLIGISNRRVKGLDMSEFILWNSQPLEGWASKYAPGKFVDLGGRKTHYIEKGKGKPVILLHGFFYDSYLWAANLDVLAENFKIYALDLVTVHEKS